MATPDKPTTGIVADKHESDHLPDVLSEADSAGKLANMTGDPPLPDVSLDAMADTADTHGVAEATGSNPTEDMDTDGAPGPGDGDTNNQTTEPSDPDNGSRPAASSAAVPQQYTPQARSDRPTTVSGLLPVGVVGGVAHLEQSCFVCGQRWQRSVQHATGSDVYMFPLPAAGTAERRAWLKNLHWGRMASAPPPCAVVCSLHFAPSDCRFLADQPGTAQLLPVAQPRRSHHDWTDSDLSQPCSYPLCRGQRRALLTILTEIGQRGSPPLRRVVRPYWSRRRFPLPELGPVNQAWVELFTDALNGKPGVPDEVELSYLCCLHFAPKWFRWENRGRSRQLDEPLGEPKLDKYAEPTVFSSSALVSALQMALRMDVTRQEEDVKRQKLVAQAAPEQPFCDYPYCPADTSEVVFDFPREPGRRQVWVRALRAVKDVLGDDAADCFQPDKCERLCISHFHEDHVVRTEEDGIVAITLDDKALPSRFRRPAQGEAPRVPGPAPAPVAICWQDALGRLIDQAALASSADGAASSDEEDGNRLFPAVSQVELHIKLEPQPENRQSPRGRGRGRPRGRPRGSGHGATSAASASAPAASPSPPPVKRARGAGRPPSQATLAQRQVQHLVKAAGAGHFGSFRALDEMLGVTEPTPRSSADQLIRMCLMLRLKEGAYQKAAASEQSA